MGATAYVLAAVGDLYATFPPMTVIKTRINGRRPRLAGSPDSITKSASFPSSRVPLSVSSNDVKAASRVYAEIASKGEIRWDGNGAFAADDIP